MTNILKNIDYIVPSLVFQTSDFSLLNRCILYYPSLNILYTYIPKNGCSTLKYTLGVDSKVITQKQNPHQTEHLFRCSNKMNFFPKNCQKIICFREPFSRIVTAYLDKFARLKPEPEAALVIKEIHETKKNTSIGNSISFFEFLTYLNQKPNKGHDAHWRPQTDFIFFEEYSKVFLLESLSNEWPEYFPNIPLLDFKTHSTSNRYKPKDEKVHVNGEQLAIEAVENGFPDLNSFASDEAQDIFNKRYSDDIVLYDSLLRNRK